MLGDHRGAHRSALHRTTDTVRSVVARVLVALAVIAAIAAPAIGVQVHDAVAEQVRHDAETTTRVTGRLAESTEAAWYPTDAAEPADVYARVTWTTPDGKQAEGVAPVEPGLAAGTEVPVWLGEDGEPRTEPLAGSTAVLCGVVAGVAVAGVLAGLLYLAWWTTDRVLLAVNARRWEQEWAVVEPQWRREYR